MIDGGSTSSVSASSNPHPPSSSSTGASLTQRLASLNFGDRNKGEHRRNFSLPTRGSSAGAGSTGGFGGHARTSSGSGNVDLNSSLSSLNHDEWIDLVRLHLKLIVIQWGLKYQTFECRPIQITDEIVRWATSNNRSWLTITLMLALESQCVLVGVLILRIWPNRYRITKELLSKSQLVQLPHLCLCRLHRLKP